MLFRFAVAFGAIALTTTFSLFAQQALDDGLPAPGTAVIKPTTAESAWIDLRQSKEANSKPQSAPRWVEAVSLVSSQMANGSPKAIFRIRVAHPMGDYSVMFLRIFFDDVQDHLPELVCWDESGTQVLHSGALGSGLGLPTSQSELIPMNDVTVIDIEVPGDGKNVRGVYMDWMTSSETVHPLGASMRDVIPEPFSSNPPLHAPKQDVEEFGTVTATLAPETIPIGPDIQEAASFQFDMEEQPLLALLTFDVASPRVDSPPEVYVNGESLGPANVVLPDLADPGYRGQTESMVKAMQFQYTGWLRAQKVIPAANLKSGKNDILILSGAASTQSAIRGTQVQLKYLWDKLDYQLRPAQPQ
jgi:hypothetical protein